jgi:hypothetical protein
VEKQERKYFEKLEKYGISMDFKDFEDGVLAVQ